MALYHINFHTVLGTPVFEHLAFDQAMREIFRAVLRRHQILCLAWEVMPTHVHLIFNDFPDQPRGRIVNLLKGATAHAFMRQFPDLRADLLGGHLWAKGYYWAQIESHRQFVTTLAYVRDNRAHADLPAPVPLQFSNDPPAPN
jgi:putative transposase